MTDKETIVILENKLTAMSFVEKYPLTRFMTEEQIDYKTATVKEAVSLNVIMIGFGKDNRELFLTSVANDRFLTLKNGELTEKTVNYYIFDESGEACGESLKDNYYRFLQAAHDGKEYLPLPKKPADERFFKLERENIGCDIVKNVKLNANSYTYIVIDAENGAALSEDIAVALKQSGDIGRLIIFVNSGITPEISAVEQGALAVSRHLMYCASDDRETALGRWYALPEVLRESNVYACLAIRSKLHLLNFDYTSDEKAQSAEAEFSEAYQRGDRIEYEDSEAALGRKRIKYTNAMKTDSVRYALAVQEHDRWNAFMIIKGFVPIPIDEVKSGTVKDIENRRHSNITTFEGLKLFRRLRAESLNLSEEETDVIRYDYQLMDDVAWLLSSNGYKIIKKRTEGKNDQRNDDRRKARGEQNNSAMRIYRQ